MALYLGKDLVSASSGSGGVTIKNQDKNITANGTYRADSGYTGLGVVKVDVQPKNQDKTFTENGTYAHDSGYTGLGEVVVAVPPTPPNNQDITVKENGTYTAENGYTGLGTVTVEVPTGGGDVKLIDWVSGTLEELAEGDIAGATTIRDAAFNGLTSLKKVAIPESVTRLGKSAFYNCTNIEEIYFNATSMNDISGTGNAFYNAGNNSGGIKVVIGKKVTRIPNYLFYNVKKITSLEYENGINCTSIGNFAFRTCESLKSVIIPETITSLGEGAFRECKGLEEIYFNAIAMNDVGYQDCVFGDVGISSNGTRVIIGKNVTKIPRYLFCPNYSTSQNVPNITSVEFAEGSVCTTIDQNAFKNCSYLQNITIPDVVTSIGNSAFSNCIALTSIRIPKNVTSIGGATFYGCTAMVFYDFTSHTSVPTLASTNAFTSIPSTCQIKVPASLYDEWIAATNWSTYASQIVAV